MKERLAILKEALAFFGPEGPPTDRSARQDQLAELFKKNDTIFEALDSRYYKSVFPGGERSARIFNHADGRWPAGRRELTTPFLGERSGMGRS